MTRPGAFAFAALLGIAAAAAPAQDAGDRVRLDDFALPPAADPDPAPQQLVERGGVLPDEQLVDRSLAQPPAGERSAPAPAQLSQTGLATAPAQLGSRGESAPAAGIAVSSTRDSRPQGVARIGGRDRCDPQLVQRLYAECLRILELRSNEFTAPEPATLSAEQRLLVEQRQGDEATSGTSATMRLRYATTAQPDADLQSNQELASIYLDPPPATRREEPAPAEDAAKLGEVLKGLGIETVPLPPPQPPGG